MLNSLKSEYCAKYHFLISILVGSLQETFRSPTKRLVHIVIMYSLCENLFKLPVSRSKVWESCALKFTKTILYNLFFSLLGTVGFLNYSKSRSTIGTMIK